MAALDETSDQSRSTSLRGPVFVDASGRRLRRIKLIGLGALGLVAGYVLLLLVAFIGGPNVGAPYLPLPAAPAAGDLPSAPSAPAPDAEVLQAGEDMSAGPAALPAVQAPATPPPAVLEAPPINAAVVQPASPEPVATSAPGTEPMAPGMSGTAPGQTTRPSVPPHP